MLDAAAVAIHRQRHSRRQEIERLGRRFVALAEIASLDIECSADLRQQLQVAVATPRFHPHLLWIPEAVTRRVHRPRRVCGIREDDQVGGRRMRINPVYEGRQIGTDTDP